MLSEAAVLYSKSNLSLSDTLKRLEENLVALQDPHTNDLAQKCSQLKAKWEELLLNALSTIQVPGVTLTNKNIDLYMNRLNEMLARNPNDIVLSSVRSALSQIDFTAS
ncbi:unnamed protein product [Enterobius vermicularis]|uniref:Pre-mRNA-processing factor 19 n=1 Tax=Enterobius vermicularis TaxID=51028 RepID=A0A0N4V7T0_ENTVE|nr:unnamed protein product [Enterobius vermicularis]